MHPHLLGLNRSDLAVVDRNTVYALDGKRVSARRELGTIGIHSVVPREVN